MRSYYAPLVAVINSIMLAHNDPTPNASSSTIVRVIMAIVITCDSDVRNKLKLFHMKLIRSMVGTITFNGHALSLPAANNVFCKYKTDTS